MNEASLGLLRKLDHARAKRRERFAVAKRSDNYAHPAGTRYLDEKELVKWYAAIERHIHVMRVPK